MHHLNSVSIDFNEARAYVNSTSDKAARAMAQKAIKKITGIPGGWEFWIDQEKSTEMRKVFRIYHLTLNHELLRGRYA